MSPSGDRRFEWFVPKFGPTKFRIAVGLLYLPYTGMVISYTVIGAMLAPKLYWDRVTAIGVIYFFGLGIAAHALDAIGGKTSVKPWGEHFSPKSLLRIVITSLIIAYGIGLYYIVTVSPWLMVIALLEGFFLFAYNLEWFDGRFHTDGWFAFSWGMLPVSAGFVIETNTLSYSALTFSAAMGLTSLVEIKASRPYKISKRLGESNPDQTQYEAILKAISLSVILLAIGMILWRLQD